jgi:alpha-N-arabinofuranosidase
LAKVAGHGGAWLRKIFTSLPGCLVGSGAEPIAYNPMIFGHFIEHFDNQVYGGIFDPGNPLSDEDGFRTDVIQALKDIRVPIVRWLGGCFVSTFHWLDGVGPYRHTR